MPATANKRRQLDIINTSTAKPPLPDVPKLRLSEAFRARFPEDAAAIESYNEEMVKFFKESKVIADSVG